ncbi:MAG: glycosyltransferase, partial [Anaerolineae bacterium]|nr:glycosyltransferase [Anaerolineae bacterium]
MFVQELARAAQLHNDVIVLHHAGKRRDLPGIWYIEQEHDQSLTKGIPLYRFWYRESPVPETSFMLFGMWSLLQAFRYLVKQGHQPHIIHVHVYAFGALAVLLGKIYGLPVVITEHSTAFPRGFLNLRQKLLAQFAFGWAGLVLPVSEALRKAIEDNGIKGRFRVVPNVVDTDIFYPHQSIASDGKSKQILFVGFLDKFHRKGIPNLLEALGQIYHRRNDWHLDIVGDGPARSEYEQLVSSLGLTGNVTFYGNRYKQEVAEFMSHCDFFVLPSMFETFSVVLIEALASGKPVIATSSG